MARGCWNEAGDFLKQELDLNPDCLKTKNKLGVVLVNLGDTDGAGKLFREVLDNDSLFAPAYNNLGNLAREEGRIGEAIRFYHKSIACDPKYSTPHNNLAVVYKEQGHYDLFVKEMRTARRLVGQGKGRSVFGRIFWFIGGGPLE